MIMVDLSLAKKALQARGLLRTNAEIRDALRQINQEAVYLDVRSRYEVEVWDKTSPINGRPASYFLNRPDVDPNFEIYLIKDQTGKVIFFQPHEAGVSGMVRMTGNNVMVKGREHADQYASLEAAGVVIQKLTDMLS